MGAKYDNTLNRTHRLPDGNLRRVSIIIKAHKGKYSCFVCLALFGEYDLTIHAPQKSHDFLKEEEIT